MRISIVMACLGISNFAAAQDPVWRVQGQSGESLGAVIANLGDIDGDGVDDLISGSRSFSGTAVEAGMATVISGATGSVIRTHVGSSAYERRGQQVAALGDIDGDGRGDYLVSRGAAGGTLNHVDVHSGASGAVIFTHLASAPFNTHSEITLDGLGDVDGDNVPDFIIGAWKDGPSAPNGPNAAEGMVYVISGAGGATIRTLTGLNPSWVIGKAVRGLGDIDNDGRGDYAIDAIRQPFHGFEGTAFYSGASGTYKYVWTGSYPSGVFPDNTTHTIEGIGDQNGDGIREIVIGDIGSNAYGDIYVISGGPGSSYQILNHLWPYCSGPQGSAFVTEQNGRWVADVGDINGDGRSDLGIGNMFHSAFVYTLTPFFGTELYEIREPRGSGLLDGAVGAANIIGIEDVSGDGGRDIVVSTPSYAGGLGRISVYSNAVPTPFGIGTGFGDGSGAACPCGNVAQAGRGCRNSTGLGAALKAFGSTSVAADTFYLEASDLPRLKTTLLLCSASIQNGGLGVPITDGLLVCGPPTKRLATSNSCSYGEGWWGSGLANAASISAGNTRWFQVWFRDPQGPCASGANFTPAVMVTFTP